MDFLKRFCPWLKDRSGGFSATGQPEEPRAEQTRRIEKFDPYAQMMNWAMGGHLGGPDEYRALKEDIKRGSCSELRQFLEAGGDSNLNLGHDTLLGMAIGFHNVDGVKLLLVNGASVVFGELNDDWGPYTALHNAAHHGFPDLVAVFLPFFQNVDPNWDSSTTPLHEACMRRCGHPCIAWDIKEAVNSPDEVNRFVECARLLLEAGADVNAQSRDYPGPQGDYTPLHFASDPPCQPLIDLLLAWGADPTLVDSDGNTPAFYAEQRKVAES